MSERRRLRGTRSWQCARNSRCLKDVDLVFICVYVEKKRDLERMSGFYSSA